ncbi:MAG: hypothetical protein II943_01710 [Victivallales bacterium]|nr:hypothetical protein [Victivallales bacterium]
MPNEDFQSGEYARPLRLVFVLVVFGLLLAVAYLQISPTADLNLRSRREQTRLVYIPPCRGMLLDRNGNPLNLSVPSYSIVLRPELLRDPRDTRRSTLDKMTAEITELGMSLGPEFYQFRPSVEKIERHLREAPAMPLILWEDVDADTLSRWTLLRKAHPATEVLLAWRREYREPDLAPQLRGVTKRCPPRTDGVEKFWNANAPELDGASGLERGLNDRLQGTGGVERLQTDVLSYRSNVLESVPALAGEDCRLALCLDAQKIAAERFEHGGYRGAAVAVDIHSGEVLVCMSAPAVPLGSRGNGADGGYQNRALSGYYPPGSTIKPLLALYALDRQLITETEPMVECPGYYALGTRQRLACSHVHGKTTVVNAIAGSCNVFFSDLAVNMSEESFDDFAGCFGFGERTNGVLTSEEAGGIAFSPSWARQNRKQDPQWRKGDAANAGIGQGAWIVTPMQMALATGFALTGKLLVPQFLLGGESIVRKEYDWNPEAQRLVMDGMRLCVTGGTGQHLFTPELSFLGKTGTAEVGKGQRPHAWMVAAAPAEAPRYVVVVVVENGGGGGRVAGPIARDILLTLVKSVD